MKFLKDLSKIHNSGLARSVILTGNIYDLFWDDEKYVPLMDCLKKRLKVAAGPHNRGVTQITYQVNQPVEIEESEIAKVSAVWKNTHKDDTQPMADRLRETCNNQIYGMEMLRQFTECNRRLPNRTTNDYLIIIEGADMLFPEAEISRMATADRKMVSIAHDWFSDPSFLNGSDSVILIAESRSMVHSRISKLPQVVEVEIPLPDESQRKHFLEYFSKQRNVTIEIDSVAKQSAGLSLYALRQLVCAGDTSPAAIVKKVGEYMVSQLGEGVVEFMRPNHKLADVVGFGKVKKFLSEKILPRIKTGRGRSFCFSGPIGGGKTYMGLAVAAESNAPVMIIGNIRSKWYGGTDYLTERLNRLAATFDILLIFLDEADAMFGDISSDHDTERRLTGKIQAMMSNPDLKGKVIWLLMTARIHRLSPDIRRPGRLNAIIPILDPTDEKDLADFIRWTFGDLIPESQPMDILVKKYAGCSSATFALYRDEIKDTKPATLAEAEAIVQDLMLPDIKDVREYQAAQAQLNCTHKSLLGFDPFSTIDFNNLQTEWRETIRKLEAKGVR